ncbi:Cache 3/Cache 2 fusion domain-containing protein [Rhodopila globiformis]|nr:Cache 3/Cache 2 fusion domain-containing protein [Rhodopila globiformis]
MTGKTFINRRIFVVSILGAGTAIATLLPDVGHAQMDRIKVSMAALKAKTAKLGPPKIEGTAPVAGKDVQALYFGTTKMNNFFEVVDEVVKENGGTATLFVKNGNDFVRVATNVKKDDGSRAIGTVLDPNGPVFPMIQKGDAYYGDTTILGKPYITGYDPIKDASGKVIGIYYVGYLKG